MDYKRVENIVKNVLEEEMSFLVELTVGSNNKITVRADSFEGMKMKRLKMINRKIEALLDRDKEDFDLTVSSPGVDKPLLVHDQYILNKGRLLKIKRDDDSEVIGRITEVDSDKIILTTVPQKKKESEEIEVSFKNIVEAKIEIEF